MKSMLEGYAEYYSAELSQKIQRGQYDNAMKCKNNGGNIPYDLRCSTKREKQHHPTPHRVVLFFSFGGQ